MQNDFLTFYDRKVTPSYSVSRVDKNQSCFSPGVCFACLRASYFTVRSIETIKTFLPIFIIFGYVIRFSFLSGNH